MTCNPLIGRQVHYTPMNDLTTCQAATITAVLEPTTQAVQLTIHQPNGTITTIARHNPKATLGTWHWPTTENPDTTWSKLAGTHNPDNLLIENLPPEKHLQTLEALGVFNDEQPNQ